MIRPAAEQEGREEEEMYLETYRRAGESLDHCLLYVCWCAVYDASTARPDPEKLKWSNRKG